MYTRSLARAAAIVAIALLVAACGKTYVVQTEEYAYEPVYNGRGERVFDENGAPVTRRVVVRSTTEELPKEGVVMRSATSAAKELEPLMKQLEGYKCPEITGEQIAALRSGQAQEAIARALEKCADAGENVGLVAAVATKSPIESVFGAARDMKISGDQEMTKRIGIGASAASNLGFAGAIAYGFGKAVSNSGDRVSIGDSQGGNGDIERGLAGGDQWGGGNTYIAFDNAAIQGQIPGTAQTSFDRFTPGVDNSVGGRNGVTNPNFQETTEPQLNINDDETFDSLLGL